MKNFVLIYKVNEAARDAMSTITQDEQMKSMADWHAWRDQLGDKLNDFGCMFFGGISLSAQNKTPSLGEIMGYTLVFAEDQAQAEKLTSSHPHLKWHEGASIEVKEYMKMP